jgi:beta-glucosidase
VNTNGTRTGDELVRLVEKLDLAQKVRLLTGATVWRTHAEPDIGLRALVFSDGPVGIRGEGWDERDPALTLPCPTALAATWDEALVRRCGRLLAREARRKGVDVVLAPTLNLQRSPLAGRHFEYLSEDPVLCGRIGAALVTGLRDGGAAATAKHYVANDSETERMTMDVRVGERTLREVYLAPFEAAVRAGAWVVMSAYNGVNGATMSENPLLREPLKGEWGFTGLVVSDWGSVRSTVPSARAAQDLAMPGPDGAWGEALLAAVAAGAVSEEAIDEKVLRLLRLADRVGALDGRPPRQPRVRGRALLRRSAAASMVLLRNENDLLPLDPARPLRIAVLGPNAAVARIQGGGSAGVYAGSVVSPVDGLLAAAAGVAYAPGVRVSDRPTPVGVANARDPRTGEPGVLVRLLDGADREIHAEHRLTGRVLEHADVPGAATVEIHAVLRPDAGGAWRFAVGGWGRVAIEVDGKVILAAESVVDSADPAAVHLSAPYREAVAQLVAGRDVRVVARRVLEPGAGRVCVLAADPPRRKEDAELAAAVELARASDVAVVVVGTTEEVESEGFDRTTLALPGRQDELVWAVRAANPHTVVVVNSGGPVLMPWRADVPAILLGWFAGQEAGHGLADVLFGRVEPGGRLPTTWPADERGLAPVAPVGGVLRYDEGLAVGYRGWLASGRRPAYWFGHGLGYTSWSYVELVLPPRVPAGSSATVRVRLANDGSRAGGEVVQVYLSRVDSAVERPERWLAGYARVSAGPGESVTARVSLPARAFQHWTPGGWVTEPGRYTVLAGRSVSDVRLVGVIEIE